jgi:hypothetical protein
MNPVSLDEIYLEDTMKDYTIWLKGGGCIEGTMEIDEADRLKKFAKTIGTGIDDNLRSPVEFTDIDGVVFLCRENVIAISINKPTDKDKIG